MKFYIATRLENVAQHNEVRDRLHAIGHQITYDWTTQGAVWQRGAEALVNTAILEMKGVMDADYVVVLLPGGRGTHVELGIALAAAKPVLISDHDDLNVGPNTCAFYHHPLVRRMWAMEALEFCVRRQMAPAKP